MPLAVGLVSETNLPIGLNGSQLCTTIENYSPDCAVGALFNLNFQSATGVVNTCGSSQPQVIRLTSQGMPLDAPFSWNGQTHSVPLNLANSASGGSLVWYNYTFPANTGIWQYDNLAQTSSTGAGLVFSYSPCP